MGKHCLIYYFLEYLRKIHLLVESFLIVEYFSLYFVYKHHNCLAIALLIGDAGVPDLNALLLFWCSLSDDFVLILWQVPAML